MVIHKVPKVVDLLVYQTQVASCFSVKFFNFVGSMLNYNSMGHKNIVPR